MLGEPMNKETKKDSATQIGPIFAHVRRRTTIYVSAVAIAIAAALGAASIETIPARAIGEQAPAHAIESQAPQQPIASFAPLVKRVKAAVVSIRVKAKASPKLAMNQDDDDQSDANPFEGTPFERFFNGPNAPFKQFKQPNGKEPMVMAQGSGFFISSDGYLVTNNHVANNAVSLEVVMDDGKTYPAKVIGTDPRTDLALLKVDGKHDFSFVKLSDQQVQVGDWVVAMGNPFGLGGTVTAGIVSAEGRNIGEGPYDNFLQIDAPVNKGNSGGPTFNQDGEVIGVNTAIYSPSGGSVGIAFAIPARTVESVVTQLKEHGHVTRGWLGVQIQSITPEIADSLGLKTDTGALVASPQSGSPAEKAGLQSGDLITELNGSTVKDARDLAQKIANIEPSKDVKLTILRGGKSQMVSLKLGELSDNPVSKASIEQPQKNEMSQLGIHVAPASEVTGDNSTGLAVVSVDPGSTAAEAGLTEGDIILKVGSSNVSQAGDLRRALKEANDSGKNHAIALVKRNGNQLFLALPTKIG
jgi:serine protease Do